MWFVFCDANHLLSSFQANAKQIQENLNHLPTHQYRIVDQLPNKINILALHKL